MSGAAARNLGNPGARSRACFSRCLHFGTQFCQVQSDAARRLPGTRIDWKRWQRALPGLIDLDDSLRPAGRDLIDDILLAISPILRTSLTDLSQEAKLRLLLIGELWYRRVLTLTGSTPGGPGDATTAKGAIELLASALPALRLLALADEPVNLRSHNSRKVPPFADPQMMFEAHRILRSADRAPLKLPTLEESLAKLPSIAERMAFLVDLGKLLNIDRRK